MPRLEAVRPKVSCLSSKNRKSSGFCWSKTAPATMAPLGAPCGQSLARLQDQQSTRSIAYNGGTAISESSSRARQRFAFGLSGGVLPPTHWNDRSSQIRIHGHDHQRRPEPPQGRRQRVMAISTLWPKPPRWPIQPGAVDPGGRWVWHTRPRFILPLWEQASAGAAQRYVGLAQTRRSAKTWQLNAGAAAMHTRYGPGVSIPTDNGARARGTRRQQSKLRRLGAERALHDRPADQRSIWWRINQAPVPVGHFKHCRSHSMAVVRHHAEPASPGQWWRHGHDHVVGRDRERYDLVDDRRHMATGTPRAVRGRLVACLQYGGGDQHQRPVRHLPLGLGVLNLAGLQRRHRAHRVLRLIRTPAMVRRWHADPFGFLRPWNELPALMGSAPPATPPRPAPAWSPS